MSFRRLLNNMILKSTMYEIVKKPPILKKFPKSNLKLNLEYIIAHRLLSAKDFFFVQIGANDGTGNDPIYPFVKQYKLRGLVLEPLKDIFEVLQNNYADEEGVICVNKAIHADLKETQLYRIDRNANLSGLPVWATRIASLDKRVIDTHKKHIPEYDNLVTRETVQCMTLNELFHEYHVENIDLLQIDTEGYDYEIIKMIDFDKMKPGIIRYESKHLSKQDNASCLEYLIQYDYKMLYEYHDITAYLETI